MKWPDAGALLTSLSTVFRTNAGMSGGGAGLWRRAKAGAARAKTQAIVGNRRSMIEVNISPQVLDDASRVGRCIQLKFRAVEAHRRLAKIPEFLRKAHAGWADDLQFDSPQSNQ
jgi:hypothetical protein